MIFYCGVDYMGSKIFREKSIERVSSPEQLDDYLKVPNVGIWVVLLTLLVMAVSVFVWALAGDIVNKVDTTGVFIKGANSDRLSVRGAVSSDDVKSMTLDMKCKIYDRYSQDKECMLGHITYISKEISGIDVSDYPEDWVSPLIKNSSECASVLIDIEEDNKNGSKYKWNDGKASQNLAFMKQGGLCKVEIIKETVKPINFLFSA